MKRFVVVLVAAALGAAVVALWPSAEDREAPKTGATAVQQEATGSGHSVPAKAPPYITIEHLDRVSVPGHAEPVPLSKLTPKEAAQVRAVAPDAPLPPAR